MTPTKTLGNIGKGIRKGMAKAKQHIRNAAFKAFSPARKTSSPVRLMAQKKRFKFDEPMTGRSRFRVDNSKPGSTAGRRADRIKQNQRNIQDYGAAAPTRESIKYWWKARPKGKIERNLRNAGNWTAKKTAPVRKYTTTPLGKAANTMVVKPVTAAGKWAGRNPRKAAAITAAGNMAQRTASTNKKKFGGILFK
jgi:hypothetical protein